MYGFKIKRVNTGEELDLLSDWKMYLDNPMPQQPPEIQEYAIEVPGMNGLLDLSDSIAGVRYKNRTLSFSLGGVFEENEWPRMYSKFMNKYHGQMVEVILDIDPDWYYTGRLKVMGGLERIVRIGTMGIEINADPFKYAIRSTLDDYLWDTFSFEDGIARDYRNIEVENSLQFIIVGSNQDLVPGIILKSGEITVTFRGVTHLLVPGENKFYDFVLLAYEENVFDFSGTGVIEIDFREVSL